MNLQRRRGFTLVELLVVLAIIGVLASLTLPALSFAKFQGKNTVCRNNLRQLGLALEIYATTFETYPPYASPVESQPGDTWYRWDMLLARLAAPARPVSPVTPSKGSEVQGRIFLCPLLIGQPANLRNPAAPAWDSAFRYNSSGVAAGFGGLGLGGSLIEFPRLAPTKQSALLAPSAMIAAGDPLTRSPDTRRDGSYDPVTARFRPQPLGEAPSVLDPRAFTVYRNHRNRYNRLACAGQVETENFQRPFPEDDAYLSRWNIDHEPHRDAWRAGP